MANRLSIVVRSSTDLRDEWRERSSDFGWAFPSDWHVPAVDAVCDAVSADVDAWAAAERLGRQRAAAGVSLAEALADVDGLAALIPSRYTEPLRRAVSLGWAEKITAPTCSVADPLTGLVTTDYLGIRLGELYRAADVDGVALPGRFALVVIRLDLAGRTGWQRTLPMILVGDGMRQIFDGGQTLALLGESVAVVLSERDQLLARRARVLCSMIARQMELDPEILVPPPSVWIERLPTKFAAATNLIAELGR